MNEFDKWWSNNITEINKRYEDGTLQEFIYLAGAAAGYAKGVTTMREKCAEVAIASRYPTNFIYAEEMDGYNAARMYIVAAIRKIGT